ncbi:MAG: PAS domain S-box protein [Bacteroidetes bacterium]|nr:PAS domain S-box protein [Bacteroidota bacterium]
METTANKIKILHLEDLPFDAELVERELKNGGIDFEKIVVDNEADFKNALDSFSPDIILSDHSLPSFDSIQALQIVKERKLHIPFILITSTMTDEFAVTIMRGGADDYIIKDRLHRVPSAVLNCIEKFRLENEKQKFLEQIAENEIRFRALIEKSVDMKTLSSEDGKFIYGSPSVFKKFGYAPEEFLDKSASLFFHPDDVADFLINRNYIKERAGASFSFQYRFLHKNGTWIWCEGTLTNFLHEPGIHAFVSNFRDISEKKLGEQLREFDKNNLSALINNTKDLMWSVDTSFNLITSNKPFDEMIKANFGRGIEKGDNVLSVVFNDKELNDSRKLYERAFLGESFSKIEYIDFPDELWTETSYYPIRINDKVIGTACHSRDITENKKAERKLKNSEAFNRGILNSLTSHIAVVNSEGYILAVNNSWRIFAKENGDATLLSTGVGSNYFEVCEKAIRANAEMSVEALKGIKDVFSGMTEDFYLEYPCHSPREKRWFGMRVMKFDSDEPLVVVTHQNITERKNAEDEIIEKNIQLKSLLQIAQTIREEERKNVAREIHDELGQQLTALKMDLDWILHKQNNSDTKVVSKLNEMLKMNDGIINTVRRISSDLRPAIIDDLGLIATIEWKCADFEEKSNITCRFSSTIKERKFSKNFSINVYRILQETLTNVARHSEATKVDILVSGDQKEFILEIKDNGKGISEENITNNKRLGILGMKERAGILDGELIITGNAKKGTSVKLILSLENEYINS